MTKIMLVEDEENIAETLKYNLIREGYDVTTTGDGRRALEIFNQEKPDLLILDLMLPGMNGLDFCRKIRQISIIPILILTAREDELNKILGLELGADDYMTKPFKLREVIARVRALLRRMEMLDSNSPASKILQNDPSNQLDTSSNDYLKSQNEVKISELTINPDKHTVMVGDRQITLKPKEFDLLIFLARNSGNVFTRENLLEQVWGYNYTGGTRTVDVHIRWLREKLELNPAKPYYIHTIFGIGYKLGIE